MPLPYNIWGGDLFWLGVGGAERNWSFQEDTGFTFFRGFLPQQGRGDLWTLYYAQGVPEWGGNLPYYHPCPWDIYTNRPFKYRMMPASAFDPVHGVLSYYILSGDLGDPSLNPGADHEGYLSAISSSFQHGMGDWRFFQHTDGGWVANYPDYGLSLITPGDYGCMDYHFITQDGQTPLLVVVIDEGTMMVSWDWGETWSTPVWAEEYPSPWDGGFYHLSDMAVCAGPPGSEVLMVCGGNDIWRSDDLGLSMHIGYAAEEWDPSYPYDDSGSIMGDCHVMACNGKQEPDTVYLGMSYFEVDPNGPPAEPERVVQRNLTYKCEPQQWESEAYPVISQEFLDDIYVGSCFYPPDFPNQSFAGDPFTINYVCTAMKYLPGTERWWAFCDWYDPDFAIFSDDDGKTWSNILCDHANPGNHQHMHPFFAPARWPWSWSYDYYLGTNLSGPGWFLDIVEHPDDPQIVISLGAPWWKADYEVADPCGRWDGTFQPVRKVNMEEAEFLKHPEYAPCLEALGGFEYSCLSISHDGGNTWGRPFSIAHRWNVDQDCCTGSGTYGWNPYITRLYSFR